MLKVQYHYRIGIPRKGVRGEESLEARDSDDHEDDRGDDRPRRLKAPIVGGRIQRPFRVPFADPELEHRVRDEDHDQHANGDRGDEHEVKQLLRRFLTRRERCGADASCKDQDQEECEPQGAHPPEARHRLANSDSL